MGLLRFYYVALSSPLFVIRTIFKCRKYMADSKTYDEEKRYRYAQQVMDHMRKRGRTTTNVYGLENLPKDGGYIMYSNHQGKYDALGIFLNHEKTCSVLMEKKQSEKILAKQIIDLLGGKRLDFDNPKQQIQILNEITAEAKNGRRFLIFPEGGYKDNKNTLQRFNSGCFRCSLGSKTPIIPVAIVDSYKSLNVNNLKKCVTQVHFLKPIEYAEYMNLKKNELCDLVKQRIQEKLDMVLA